MKRIRRALSALLAAALLLTALGCQTLKPEAESTPITVDIAGKTPSPATESGDTNAAPADPEATGTPDPGAGSAFDALDLEIFRWYATQDGYSFHQLVDNPADFGLDRSMVEMTLGEFTEESTHQYAVEAQAFLERLTQIPRSKLTEAQQLSYDVIEQYLEGTVESDAYAYFYEPLTEYSGLHANLPLSFALFQIDSEQDAEDYLLLLADTPRYLSQVLDYEKQRASLGMFMTEAALDAILGDCKAIADSKDDSFLYATFNEAVDALDSLDATRADALKKRNAELIKSDFTGAYRTLYEGLGSLRHACRDGEGAYALGSKALDYYELSFRDHADNDLSVEESLELLQDEMLYFLMQYLEIIEANPEAVDAVTGKVTLASTEENLALLREVTAKVLPELPEHALTVSDVPEELEDMMSPAAYVIPSLDGWNQNRILINTASESETPLFTLAHESYPGHLYQYVYQRSLQETGVMQRALHYGAYAEAWSQLGELLFINNQSRFNQDYCRMQFYFSIVTNVVLPCMVSIWVNYQGYNQDAVKLKLDALLGEQSEAAAKIYYDLAVDQPYYTVYYAMGFSQITQMMQEAETDLGDAFNQKEYLTAYLNLGPGYFNLIRERMDVWVDARVLEVLGE